MYEYEKCGTAIKNALAQHGIYYCAIDDFCTAGTEDMKRAVLFAELEKHLPTLIGENPLELTHKLYEVSVMLKTPELAMPRSRKVTTICNGKRDVWTNYEQAKAYFLELMMSTDGEDRDRVECVYIQLLRGLDECGDENV